MRQLKHLSLLLGLLLLGPSTYAQSVRFQSQAISSRGAGIANATVAVCTQPANTNTQPCSPLATLATSTSTTSGGANPLTADSFGNFFFYAAPGRYTVQIYGPAVSGQFVTPDTPVGLDPGANYTLTNVNSSVACDGSKYPTIQAAAAALAATGGEVIVPSASTCTWNGAGMTGNVTIRFNSATAAYAVTAPIVMTGGGNHLICNTGQPIGLSGQNNAGFQNVGTLLTFASLTGTQDAISSSGNNNNDGNSVEGCYIRMTSGRDAIHWSGTNGSWTKNVIIDDPPRDGVRLDAGTTSGSHSYGNTFDHTDVVHAGGVGYHLITNQGAGSTDIDRTHFLQAEYHTRDVGGSTSTGGCWTLEVPSGAVAAQSIGNTIWIDSICNGSANGTPGLQLIVSQAGVGNFIRVANWMSGEIEDVFQSNTAKGILITDTAANDVVHLWFMPDACCYAGGSDNFSSTTVQDFFRRGDTPTTGSINQWDYLTIAPQAASPSTTVGGFSFGALRFIPTTDNVLHLFRTDNTTDQLKIDTGNQRLLPSTSSTWKLGDHTTSIFTESAVANAYVATSFNFAGNNLLMSSTAPTIAAAGCGGAAASIVVSNGTGAFKVNVGTTPTSSCTLTFPAATTGWNVTCNDITTQSTAVFVQKQTGVESTTSVTITNFNDVAVATAFVASDILKCTASAD